MLVVAPAATLTSLSLVRSMDFWAGCVAHSEGLASLTLIDSALFELHCCSRHHED